MVINYPAFTPLCLCTAKTIAIIIRSKHDGIYTQKFASAERLATNPQSKKVRQNKFGQRHTAETMARNTSNIANSEFIQKLEGNSLEHVNSASGNARQLTRHGPC